MSNPEARVLIVEGNDALRVMIFTVLRHQPLAVDTASTADEAMEKVETCDYALILIDMNLPDGEGPQFLPKKDERPDILIVLQHRHAQNRPRTNGFDEGHYAGIALNIGLVRPHIDNVSYLLRIDYAG